MHMEVVKNQEVVGLHSSELRKVRKQIPSSTVSNTQYQDLHLFLPFSLFRLVVLFSSVGVLFFLLPFGGNIFQWALLKSRNSNKH